jgi:hypothetical protein
VDFAPEWILLQSGFCSKEDICMGKPGDISDRKRRNGEIVRQFYE